MTSFTFTAEQLRHAPPLVRHWVVHEIEQALSAAQRPTHDPTQVEAAALAACTEQEAFHVFTTIRNNFVITQVFFELARDAAPGVRTPPLHPLNTGEILRHTRLAHADALLKCLNVINEAFQQIRRDPGASLFGFDGHGHVYIHEATHLSIRHLFEQLVRPSTTIATGADPGLVLAAADFAPPRSAASDDVLFDMADQQSAPDVAGTVAQAGNGTEYTQPRETIAAEVPTSVRQQPRPSRSVHARPAPTQRR